MLNIDVGNFVHGQLVTIVLLLSLYCFGILSTQTLLYLSKNDLGEVDCLLHRQKKKKKRNEKY